LITAAIAAMILGASWTLPAAPKAATQAATHKPAKKPPKLAPKDAQYQNAVKGWHAPAPTTPDPNLPAKLVLVSLNSGERVELDANGESGAFSARAAEEARWLFRERGSGRSHPIEPLLLDTLYRIQRHFNAPMLRVISGYRAPKPGSHSNHGRGRACDFVVPGATDKDVAELARSYGFRGVGIYPKSGFVHVDIRERSYFWVDNSRPGKKNRERGILTGDAASADKEARARGDVVPPPYAVKPPTAEQTAPADEPMDDDEDDMDSES
jgi:uncharacterized protein YcbK (DUF882 family)